MQTMIGALPLWLSMLAFPEQHAKGTREQGLGARW
jgi:hypothetical protein